MKVGIDARPLAARSGGIRRYTERLIHGLASIDKRSQYRLYGLPPSFSSAESNDTVVRDTVGFPGKRFADQIYISSSNENIDLFHGTNYSAPLFGRFPTVLTIHDLTVQLFPESHPLNRRLRHRLLPLLCRRAARIIADSYNTKRDLLENFNTRPSKIDVVYLAADSAFHPVADEGELERVRLCLGLPDSFVLFVGAVEPRKNLPLLIRSMASLIREGCQRRLVIAGLGTSRYIAKLKALVQTENLRVGRDVIFTGIVEESDMASLYTLCDLFAYPSKYEGFGLPPIEAMACGAPVLLLDNSSFSELYGDVAVLAAPDRSEDFLAALRTLLLSSDLRCEIGEKGLKFAQSRSWADVASETRGVYRQALEDG